MKDLCFQRITCFPKKGNWFSKAYVLVMQLATSRPTKRQVAILLLTINHSILSPTPKSTRTSNEAIIFNSNNLIVVSKTRMLAFLIGDQICLYMLRSFSILVL